VVLCLAGGREKRRDEGEKIRKNQKMTTLVVKKAAFMIKNNFICRCCWFYFVENTDD
jgi:hypothetical protein